MLEEIISQGEPAGYYVLMATIVLMTFWEGKIPRRALLKPIRLRWTRNFGMFLTSALIARLLLPFVGVEVALQATDSELGLLNFLGAPLWVNLLIGLLALDLLRYGQHWISHRFAFLWRIHRLHHTDQEFDYTTSLRFHPVELCWVTLVNVALIAALGLHPLTVIVTEAISLGVNTWNHGNLHLPLWLDRTLRRFIITPDMHRVHHSSLPREFNANLGGLLPWWDHLFGTYIDQPRHGHQDMVIGLRGYADEDTSFVKLLLDPLSSPANVSSPGLEVKQQYQATSD